jgi:hypothetical protein
MSKFELCIDFNSFSPFRPSDGASDEAVRIHELGVYSFSGFFEAFTLSTSMELVSEVVDEIYEECSEAGWDGYDAAPVRACALTDAMKLIRMLPSSIPVPKIAPEPSGGLTLRWSRGKVKTFILAIYGNEVLDYAAIIGSERQHGRLEFKDFLPSKVPKILIESNITNAF